MTNEGSKRSEETKLKMKKAWAIRRNRPKDWISPAKQKKLDMEANPHKYRATIKLPPVSRRKLGAAAQAEHGQDRTCLQCDVTKEVNNKNYTPYNAGKRGWKTICRQCEAENYKAQGKEVLGEHDIAHSKDHTKLTPEQLKKSRVMGQQERYQREHHQKNTDMIEEMYNLFYSKQNTKRLDEIVEDLQDQVRSLFNEGKKEESFELFIHILKPLIIDWVEPGEIHENIKRGLLSEHRRVLIIATRYSAKTTLTKMYVAWEIFLNPLMNVLIISRGAKLARRFMGTVRKVFIENCPVLDHLKPTGLCLDSSEEYQTPQSVAVSTGGITLSCLGRGSNLPGFRADLTIADDIESQLDDTPEKVVSLEEELNELHMINPKGRKILLGTYQTEFSIYAKLADLADSEGVPTWEEHRALMFEEVLVNGKLKSIKSRWKEMYSDKDGLDWRKSVTLRAWRLHIMLIADPAILNERPLKISDLLVCKGDPMAMNFPISAVRTNIEAEDLNRWSAPKGDAWYYGDTEGKPPAPYAENVMVVDPASGMAGRDAIGVAILSVTQAGFGVIRHLEGVRNANKKDSMRRLAQIAKIYNISVLLVEETAESLFGDTLENELIIIGYPVSVTSITTKNIKKGQRIIDNLAPPMGAGRLIILECVVESDHGGEFVNQLVRISYDGRTGSAKDHDDIVDALSHAVAHVRGSLISDIADNISGYKTNQLDKWARVPLRYGGLGAYDQDEYSDTNRMSIASYSGELSMGEALMMEDEVLISLTERRDRLNEVVVEDRAFNRTPDPGTVAKIKVLNKQITELKQLNVF
jgi:hypothetical protein